VKDAVDEATSTQEGRQAKLLDELNSEKDAFDKRLERYAEDLKKCKFFGEYDAWEESSSGVNELFDGLQAAKATVKDFNMREAVFKFPPTEYPAIEVIEKDLDPCFKLWNMIAEFNTNQKEWMNGSFLGINAPKVESDVVEWYKSSAKMAKLLADEYPKAASCASRLREVTGDFRKYLPVMVALATPALKQRHWDQLSELLGSPLHLPPLSILFITCQRPVHVSYEQVLSPQSNPRRTSHWRSSWATVLPTILRKSKRLVCMPTSSLVSRRILPP
jgi:dynein heavy chain